MRTRPSSPHCTAPATHARRPHSLAFHRSTLIKRRNRDAAFAAEWDAALALHERLLAGDAAEKAEGKPHVIRTA